MEKFLENLVQATAPATADKFKPVARYYADMDFMLYVNENCSYRADRVDAFLTVLWHPQDDRLVGIKLKGFKLLFDQLRAVVGEVLRPDHFLPLIKALELAYVGGIAETIISSYENEKRKQRTRELYAKARELLTKEQPAFNAGDELLRKAA
jgi:hypothetical protein